MPDRRPAPPPSTSSLRILCLHGGRQTSAIFRERISRLKQQLAKAGLGELIFVDGPIELPLAAGDTAALLNGGREGQPRRR